MRVKITKATRSTYWYADEVGKVFEVNAADKRIDPEGTRWECAKGFINKDDCEVVKDGVDPTICAIWAKDATQDVLEAYLPAIQAELAERAKPKPLTDSEMWDWMKAHLRDVSSAYGLFGDVRVSLNLVSSSSKADAEAHKQILQRVGGGNV